MNPSKLCYISHPPIKEKVDDLRPVLTKALLERDHQPVYQNQTYVGNTILIGVCKDIYSSSLCVFEIAKSYPQIHVEIGIALAYNKPIIIIAEKDQTIPLTLQGYSILLYDGYLELAGKFGDVVSNNVNKINPSDEDFCIFCNHHCEGMLTSQDKNSYTILNKAGLLQRGDWEQVKFITSSYFSNHRMYPKYLAESGSYSRLCDMKKKIFSSRFSFSHPGYMSDELSYLGLGLTIGKSYPWILARKKGDKKWPEILDGVGSISYETFRELSDNLDSSLEEFTREVTSQKKSGETSSVSMLSTWVQLDDWIEEQNAKNSDLRTKIVGDLKLIHSQGTGVINKYIIPPSGLTLGSDYTCDVVVDHELVSHLHAQITVGKDGNYYIMDVGSKNGTYLNGKRILNNSRVKLTINSILRIPGAKFLVADDETSLFELTKQSPAKQRNTGILNKIDLLNEFPPEGNEEDDFLSILKVRIMPEGKDVSFAIQTYYRMGKVLPEVQKYFRVETDEDYCFSLGNFELVDRSQIFSKLNLLSTQVVYLRKFANLVTAVFADYEFEITDPNTTLPCVSWIVSFPQNAMDTNPQKYAIFIKKTGLKEIDIEDMQSSVKIMSESMGVSLLSIIITADTLDSISENIKDRAAQSKIRILDYVAFQKSIRDDAKKAL